MSYDDDTGLKSTADDVEISVQLRADDGRFDLKPQIANYERFDVAARLSFPLPESLDAGQISPAATEADVWSVEDGELVLIDRIEWASTVEHTVSLEASDRSQVEALVTAATIELTNMDGTELAVQSSIQIESPHGGRRPAAESGEARTGAESSSGTPEATDEGSGTAARSQTGESDQDTAVPDDEDAATPGRASAGDGDDVSDVAPTEEPADPSAGSGADSVEYTECDEDMDRTAESGSDGTSDEPSTASGSESVQTADGADDSRPDDPVRPSDGSDPERDADTASGSTESRADTVPDQLPVVSPATSTEASDESTAADGDASSFTWFEIESDEPDSDGHTAATDGVLDRLRSMFSE